MRHVLLASFAVIHLASCGATAPNDDAACAAVAAARCQRLAACSTADLQRRFVDEPSCEARQKLACLDGLDAPDTGATAATVNTCAAALPSEGCSDFLGNETVDACQPQTGLRLEGAACEFSGQCATAFCAMATDAVCGTCQPKPIAGTSCASSACGTGLVCVASTMTCQVPVAASGACSADQPCAQGLTCVAGACTAELTTAGAPCDPKHATAPDCSADAGFTCDATTKQCVAQPIVAAGMTCGNVSGVATRCAAGAQCIRAAGASTGTCVAPAADGAACDTAVGPGCAFPARCVPGSATGTAGTCTLPGAVACS